MDSQNRVICLYRVSLPKQVDRVEHDGQTVADIPMQRTACRKYCNEHGWTIIGEFQETGISGYKNSTFQRTAVKEIIAAANEQSFDTLLVCTVDRLSRRDYELPMLFEQITECGITVLKQKKEQLRKVQQRYIVCHHGNWSVIESMVPEFFTRILIGKEYKIQHSISPKIKQYLSVDITHDLILKKRLLLSQPEM